MGDTSEHEWSRWLRRATERPGWSVVRLARESGIHRSTIHRWLTDGGDSVTIESIRAIATALGEPLESALRAAAGLPALEPSVDEELALIRGAAIDERLKIALVRRLLERREEDQAQRVRDLRVMIGDR